MTNITDFPKPKPYLTETQPDAPSPFSSTIPRLQVIWDSTTIGTLKTCPRKYYLSIIEGWTLRRVAPALDFGIAIHSALEYFDRQLAKSIDRETALRMTLRHALEITGAEKEIQVCQSCTSKLHPDESFCGHCGGEPRSAVSWIPWTTHDTARNIKTLFRAIVWYEEVYRNESLKTYTFPDGRPAVELSFKFDTGEKFDSTGESILLCGHFDKIAIDPHDTILVLDRKSTKGQLNTQFFAGFNPDPQMSQYTFASQIVFNIPAAGTIIDGMELGVNYTRFRRGETRRTKSQLDEWFRDTIWWIRQAEGFAKSNHWPMNDKSCGMYGGCPFREVCGKTPEVRQRYLEADYTRRPWNPAQPR